MPRMKDINTALLSKLFWKLVNMQGDAATSILRAKYGGWHMLAISVLQPNCSALWRGLLKVAPWTIRGL